ncbi:DUF309 domain-containing protein [bacterium]|nr:DUF309 domain-containing protein [bacterium]
MQKINPNAVKGLALFNQQSFYDAHEYFETAWRETPAPQREFYRALLQISGGYFRLTQDNGKAAKKFFNHALGWLADFVDPQYGIDTDGLRSHLSTLITALEDNRAPNLVFEQYYTPIERHLPQEPA